MSSSFFRWCEKFQWVASSFSYVYSTPPTWTWQVISCWSSLLRGWSQHFSMASSYWDSFWWWVYSENSKIWPLGLRSQVVELVFSDKNSYCNWYSFKANESNRAEVLKKISDNGLSISELMTYDSLWWPKVVWYHWYHHHFQWTEVAEFLESVLLSSHSIDFIILYWKFLLYPSSLTSLRFSQHVPSDIAYTLWLSNRSPTLSL